MLGGVEWREEGGVRRRRCFNKAAYRSSDEAWREQLLLGAAPLCGLAASPADCRALIRNFWAARNWVDQAHGCFDLGRELLSILRCALTSWNRVGRVQRDTEAQPPQNDGKTKRG